MSLFKSPFLWFCVALLATVGLSTLGPAEASLGSSVRIVYLHGAWALTAETTLGLAAAAGLASFFFRRKALQRWSAALGYTGLFFWVSYLPLSLWAMQSNWNGLFLAEPRFRVAVIFAVTGLLLQAGLALMARPVLTALMNIIFFAALRITLAQASYIMHPPPSPIFNSGNLPLEIFFVAVTGLNICAACFLARGLEQKLP